jgi:hypothetical protein
MDSHAYMRDFGLSNLIRVVISDSLSNVGGFDYSSSEHDFYGKQDDSQGNLRTWDVDRRLSALEEHERDMVGKHSSVRLNVGTVKISGLEKFYRITDVEVFNIESPSIT